MTETKLMVLVISKKIPFMEAKYLGELFWFFGYCFFSLLKYPRAIETLLDMESTHSCLLASSVLPLAAIRDCCFENHRDSRETREFYTGYLKGSVVLFVLPFLLFVVRGV
ncbi:hypothetical protein B0T26DRAFT_696133 [Lasiosphaeria miniovina]|uniref:Uncharacterized protein n=1 Tax=Lasiosphaeria miniovina TaxID=1954250 RepID=A0AA40E8I7_9PEZI|nr:uncharacterized protein B0T26DRAFT_696133 [Lasiosphaeria miniovina]KAK0727941.1 hypothetical protein B0T26DRAFT_696133 [Lasiosphaeria miniovina]